MKSCPQCFGTYPDEYSVCPKDGTALVGPSLWEPGAVIRGKYQIVSKLGEGGMAAVYKARHQLLDEPRALKVIKADLARDAQFVRRFKNEAIITRKLQHPNAVRVDDLDIAEDGRPFIAMELVEGESLKSLMLRRGPLRVSEVLDIAYQVCEALQAAHTLGLIHRDIKPDNIFLVPRHDATPLAKVLDFGIARLKEGTPGMGLSGMTLTGTGVVIGTPEYMSPEQAMGKHSEELDGRSDLYSLGIVMYRMLTGELPFKADTTVEMILHHIQTVPRPPEALKPQLGIPPSVSAMVMEALEKDREKRFPSAAAMAEALRQAQESLASGGQLPTAVAPRAGAVTPAAEAPTPRLPSPAPSGHQVRAPRHAREVAPQPVPGVVRPFPAPPAKKAGFPTVPVAGGVIAVLVVLAGITALRRHAPPPPQREPAPQATQPSAVPTAAPPVTSEPHAGRAISSPMTEPLPSARPNLEPTAPISPGETSQAEGAEPAETNLPATSVPSEGPEVRQPRSPRPSPQRMPRRSQEATGAERPEVLELTEAGRRFYQAGEYGKAAQMFRRILAIDPNNRLAQRALEKSVNMMHEQGQRGRRRR